MSGKMVLCKCCLQWFCYNPANPWGIEVKKRGYSSSYYCGECVANCPTGCLKEVFFPDLRESLEILN